MHQCRYKGWVSEEHRQKFAALVPSQIFYERHNTAGALLSGGVFALFGLAKTCGALIAVRVEKDPGWMILFLAHVLAPFDDLFFCGRRWGMRPRTCAGVSGHALPRDLWVRVPLPKALDAL